MIRTEDALAVLNMLAAAFPSTQIADDTVALYTRTLTSEPFADLSILASAASTWVLTSDWFPTVHQISDGYRDEARRRLADRRRAEEQRAIEHGILPGVALDPGYAVEMVDVMRAALGSVSRPHNHHRGAAQCLTCVTREDVAEAVAEQARTIAAERGLRPPAVVETYACVVCRDLGFFTKSDDSCRPCHICNEAGYKRWLEGHLAPGHECGECSDLRRGR